MNQSTLIDMQDLEDHDYNNIVMVTSKNSRQPMQSETLFVYRYEQDGEKNYAVLAKSNKRPLPDRETLKRWMLMMLKAIENGKSREMRMYKERERVLSFMKIMRVFDHLDFTQEGFELLSNRFIYTGGLIDRTVFLEVLQDEKDHTMMGDFTSCDSDCQLVPGEPFQPYEFFDRNFLFTPRVMKHFNVDEEIEFIMQHQNTLYQMLLTDVTHGKPRAFTKIDDNPVIIKNRGDLDHCVNEYGPSLLYYHYIDTKVKESFPNYRQESEYSSPKAK